ncbi:hypothetical protein [Paraburkholderia sediminicola]|uniref:hypothetical protein n=1 Tax=Paraburkholderia sediminicola TaxID=458836 RepID=UPI0038B84330
MFRGAGRGKRARLGLREREAGNLRDNALWSVIAVLEYYARLYEAMPERIRRAGDGGFDAVRREAEAATDALMSKHRDALARCRETIKLAEDMTREHGARYRVTLAALNEQLLKILAERAADRIARAAGNRLVGVSAVAAREQRKRLDGAGAASFILERARCSAADNGSRGGARLVGRLACRAGWICEPVADRRRACPLRSGFVGFAVHECIDVPKRECCHVILIEGDHRILIAFILGVGARQIVVIADVVLLVGDGDEGQVEIGRALGIGREYGHTDTSGHDGFSGSGEQAAVIRACRLLRPVFGARLFR